VKLVDGDEGIEMSRKDVERAEDGRRRDEEEGRVAPPTYEAAAMTK